MAQRKSGSVVEDGQDQGSDSSEGGAEVVAGNGDTGATKRTRKPGPTLFKGRLQKVETLPPKRHGGGGRGRGPSDDYFEMLTEIINTPDLHDGWVPLGEFTTTSGAASVKRDLVKGERRVPEGVFSYDARNTETTSTLYAWYHSNPEAETQG